jgi:outer membrane protein assembly factor BamB
VYVGSWDKNLYAIDAITGLEKWRFKTGGEMYSSPAVSNGVIYVGSNDRFLYAVGMPSDQVNTEITPSSQTTVSIQTVATSPTAETNSELPPLWDRNILIYMVLVVFVVLFGALLYDTYYKKKK